MEYPNPIMSITEMVNIMHFSRDYMRRMVHHKYADKYVQKTGKAKNSKILIDTAEFEKLRKKGVLK